MNISQRRRQKVHQLFGVTSIYFCFLLPCLLNAFLGVFLAKLRICIIYSLHVKNVFALLLSTPSWCGGMLHHILTLVSPFGIGWQGRALFLGSGYHASPGQDTVPPYASPLSVPPPRPLHITEPGACHASPPITISCYAAHPMQLAAVTPSCSFLSHKRTAVCMFTSFISTYKLLHKQTLQVTPLPLLVHY